MGFTSIDGMLLTRGGLVPGMIIRISQPKSPARLLTSSLVKFMFNPDKYTVSKTNSYKAPENVGHEFPKYQFEKTNPRDLSATLHFDTYPEGVDVRLFTKPLFSMMEPEEKPTSQSTSPQWEPAQVAFVWGGVFFPGVLTSVSEVFTLFAPLGYPVRSEVTIKLQEVPLSSTAQAIATAAEAAVIAGSAIYMMTRIQSKMSKGAILSAIRSEIYQTS